MLMAGSVAREQIFRSVACYCFERTPSPKTYNAYFEQPVPSRQNRQIIDDAVPADCCCKMELVKNNLLVCNSWTSCSQSHSLRRKNWVGYLRSASFIWPTHSSRQRLSCNNSISGYMDHALALFIAKAHISAFGLVMKMASMLQHHHRLRLHLAFLNSMLGLTRRQTSSSWLQVTPSTTMKITIRLASLIQSFHSLEASRLAP